MNTLEMLYTELYCAANVEKGYQLNNERAFFKDLSHFASMKGTKYDAQKVKLLIVGRAVNGWGAFTADSAEQFAKQAVAQMQRQQFQWVQLDDCGALRNDKQDNGKWYWLNKSAFWRVSRQIWKELTGNSSFVDTQDDKWVDYIAWTNLYKIAPKESGNPTTGMCNKQLLACRDILKAEIELYKPTHILFITGYEYWFSAFEELFSNGKQTEKTTGDSFVEKAFSEGEQKIVIASRPERKNEQKYISDALSAYQELGRL